MPRHEDYSRQTDAIVPQADGRAAAIDAQEYKARRSHDDKHDRHRRSDTASAPRPAAQNHFVPSTVRHDVGNDRCRKQYACDDMRHSPAMPNLMTATTGHVQPDARHGRKDKQGDKHPIDNENRLHRKMYMTSSQILRRKVRAPAAAGTITIVNKSTVSGGS